MSSDNCSNALTSVLSNAEVWAKLEKAARQRAVMTVQSFHNSQAALNQNFQPSDCRKTCDIPTGPGALLSFLFCSRARSVLLHRIALNQPSSSRECRASSELRCSYMIYERRSAEYSNFDNGCGELLVVVQTDDGEQEWEICGSNQPLQHSFSGQGDGWCQFSG